MKKTFLKFLPFFHITGMTLDKLIDETIEMDRKQKQENSKKSQRDFLAKKEKNHARMCNKK